jgi:hypothetical protein
MQVLPKHLKAYASAVLAYALVCSITSKHVPEAAGIGFSVLQHVQAYARSTYLRRVVLCLLSGVRATETGSVILVITRTPHIAGRPS